MKASAQTAHVIKKNRIPRPFLKWVGGKTQLLPVLLKLIPDFSGTYYEPFLGGGALYFELAPKKAVIADLNQELIDCYTAIRDDVDSVIQILKKHKYQKEYFYRVRAQKPFELSLPERAARMIYLNRAGFNGLYRVNKKGEFNVPFGRYNNPTICDELNLRGCAHHLNGVELRCEMFEDVVKTCKPGDFVYFDPPYIPLSNTAYFTAYEKGKFGMADQERLATVFDELSKRGVHAMLSNSDVPWMRSRYQHHHIHSVSATRMVNSKGSKRGPVGEVIVTSFPTQSERPRKNTHRIRTSVKRIKSILKK